jgi:hypothetical protein
VRHRKRLVGQLGRKFLERFGVTCKDEVPRGLSWAACLREQPRGSSVGIAFTLKIREDRAATHVVPERLVKSQDVCNNASSRLIDQLAISNAVSTSL